MEPKGNKANQGGIMIIKDFKPFSGVHCESTATGNLLQHIGIEISEPMIFGLMEGIGYGYFSFKTMPFPFIGGRIKQFETTENLCRNLNLELDTKETSSVKKAWANVESEISAGNPVGLQLDMYHLDYFPEKFHFAGHFVAMFGFDSTHAYLVDTNRGDMKTSLESLELARNEKGAMAAKNRSYTIKKIGETNDISSVIITAIKRNAEVFLNPPIKNLGYKGISKTAKELPKYFDNNPDTRGMNFQIMGSLMEDAGTGGSIFRNLYRDFLKESAELLSNDRLGGASEEYAEIAKKWKEVSDHLVETGKTDNRKHLEDACGILEELSGLERENMEKLLEL